MKTSQQYDLTISNVDKWRKEREISRTWTPEQTKRWFQWRDRGLQRRVNKVNIYERLCVWSERFFWVCVILGGICLAFSLASFLGTVLSGRLTQILGGN